MLLRSSYFCSTLTIVLREIYLILVKGENHCCIFSFALGLLNCHKEIILLSLVFLFVDLLCSS